MKPNGMKARLARGESVLGVTLQEASIQSVEILGLLGFDYINIDCLHSSLGVEDVARMVLAAELRGLSTIVRVPDDRPDTILRYLDAGAGGIVVAEMDSAERARSLVRAVKFEPEGERSLASVHASDYGLSGPLSKFAQEANRETMAIGIVESRKGIEAIAEILAVPGLDGVIIGTTDLSKALGVTGQADHPAMREAIDTILGAAKASGKAVGITLKHGESPKAMLGRGFGFVGIHLKAMLIKAAREHLAQAKD